MVRNYRKPLIIVAPKTLLRLSAAVSSLQDMGPKTTFQPVLGDNFTDPMKITKVILCSGKHYYNLVDQRSSLNIEDTALVRLESLCPFPVFELMQETAKYPNAKRKSLCKFNRSSY